MTINVYVSISKSLLFLYLFIGKFVSSASKHGHGHGRFAQIPPLDDSYFNDNLVSELQVDFDAEKFVKTALTGNSINWYEIEGSKDDLIAHYTKIRVPVLYDGDADKYGIRSQQVRNSYFELHLRKYQWGPLDPSKPVKHVLFVSGGPGESGQIWIKKLEKLSRQYRRSNAIFYISDHRGVFESKGIVELVDRQDGDSHTHRTSWKRINRNRDGLVESTWIHNVREFEQDIGYPLVAMSCSNAARDLAVISLAISKFNTNSPSAANLFYLHAQSYGTQVAVRTLILLPDFYDSVLLQGLASMELVRESGKSDFGILKACSDDRFCSRQMRRSSESSGSDTENETDAQVITKKDRGRKSKLLSMSGPFDLKKLMEEMTSSSHNLKCRNHFHDQFTRHVYSARYTFSDCLNVALYELLADDFVNPYSATRSGRFYPGMLTLPLIRDMYYCEDFERFKRQVKKIIEVIATSVRGLDRPYVKSDKTKSSADINNDDYNAYNGTNNNTLTPLFHKGKHTDKLLHNSDFVQSYINLHEAFDMAGMTRPLEGSYCSESGPRGDLVNQCQIYREQVHKLKKLKEMTGLKDKFDQNYYAEMEEVKKGKKAAGGHMIGYEDLDIDENGKKRTILEFTINENDDSDSEEDDTAFRTVSSSGSSEEEEKKDIIETNEELERKFKKSRNHHHHNSNKKHNKKSKHRSGKNNAKWLKRKGNKYYGIVIKPDELKSKMIKKTIFDTETVTPDVDDVNVNVRFQSKTKTKEKEKEKKHKTYTSSSVRKQKRKYYYEVDDLSYSTPSTSKTRIFVAVGSLDVKTPLLTALQQFQHFKAPFKTFFELEKVAHNTDHCSTEIIRAYTATEDTERKGSLQIAHDCVKELKKRRTLDWEFKDTVNLDKRDWWI